jgi:(p)ppGpp synthase/HD superfamily hydrolase
MAVSALVLEFGGTLSQAIAALLHDTIEDCGVTRDELRCEFGSTVASLVHSCSDSAGPRGAKKAPWLERKTRHLRHLTKAPRASLMIAAADKLHNARTIIRDVQLSGPSAWSAFKAGPLEILWYYEAALTVLEDRANEMPHGLNAVGFSRLVAELRKAITEVRRLSRATTRKNAKTRR